MRYWPVPLVTVVRTFSISAGLAASTVTPGSTAPDASRTTPVSDACAAATLGSSATSTPTTTAIPQLRVRNIDLSPELLVALQTVHPCPSDQRGTGCGL